MTPVAFPPPPAAFAPVAVPISKKAISEDLVGGELHKLWPHQMAKHTTPLHLTAMMWVDPPLQWKGGHVMERLKAMLARDGIADCSSYRDITLQHLGGKTYGQDLRVALRPTLRSVVRPTQCGSGLNGGSCDLAHVSLRSIFDLAHARKLLVAGIFVDVHSAFAVADRALWSSQPESDDHLALS